MDFQALAKDQGLLPDKPACGLVSRNPCRGAIDAMHRTGEDLAKPSGRLFGIAADGRIERFPAGLTHPAADGAAKPLARCLLRSSVELPGCPTGTFGGAAL